MDTLVNWETIGDPRSPSSFRAFSIASPSVVCSGSGSEGDVTETSGCCRETESTDCTVDGEAGCEFRSIAGVSFAGGVGAGPVGLADG